jgi:Chalcone isomerase-like
MIRMIGVFVLSLAFGLMPASPAMAQAEWIKESIAGAKKLGAGPLRFLGLRIYDAELWANANFKLDSFFEHPHALKLTYARTLYGKLIAERSEQEISKLGLGDEKKRKVWLEQMTKLFPDVNKGDSLSALYTPGKGLKFLRNDAPLGDIADPEFARAFMSIWLDTGTSEPGLRKQLAGTDQPR